MNTPTDIRSDEAFEGEVRAMLARRAGDVRPAELSPDLPNGLRIAVDHRPDVRITGRGRWLAVAAAALILLAGLGLVARGGGGGDDPTGPADGGPTTVTVPPRSPMFDRLPAGIDPTAGEPLFTTPLLHHDPTAALAETLDPAFGEDLSPPMPFRVDDDEVGRWWSHYVPLAPVDPDAWGAEDPQQAETGGWVLVRRDPSSPDAGWGVVAVDSAAIDLSDVRREGDHLAGAVRLTSSAPIRVVVSRPDGERLATSDLTTPNGLGNTVSLLALDEIEVGTGPVVLRVEAGDRPGQVGLGGVGVAALAEVVLPGTGGATPEPGPPMTTVVDVPTTTVAPDDVELPELGDVVWRPTAPTDDASSAASVAYSFTERVLDDPYVGLVDGHEVSRTARIVVRMRSGADIELRLARDAEGWAVVEVGGGGVSVASAGDGDQAVNWPDPVADDATWWLVAVGPGEQLATHRMDGVLPDLGEPDSVIAVARDAEGRVVGAVGNPL